MTDDIRGVFSCIPSRDFGKPLHCSNQEPATLYDSMPEPRLRQHFTSIDPQETIISNVPEMTISSTNTDRKETTSRGMRHREGGWPNNVDPEELEDQLKFCRRVEREERYLEAVKGLVTTMDSQLRLNSAINIYETYWPDEPQSSAPQQTTSSTEAKASEQTTKGTAAGPVSLDAGSQQRATLQAVAGQYQDEDVKAALFCKAKFAFPAAHFNTPRVAMQCAWTCGSEAERMAVAYTEIPRGFGALQRLEPQTVVCVWDTHNPSAPVNVLCSRSGDASAVATSTKDPHVLVSGASNGQLSLFDTRAGTTPQASSKVGVGHHDAVTDIKFLLSKTPECFSVGLDGRVLFWDARQLDAPRDAETVVLTTGGTPTMPSGSLGGSMAMAASTGGRRKSSASPISPAEASTASVPFEEVVGTRCAATVVDYDPMVGGAQKYLVGCVDGRVFNCNRRGRAQALDALYGSVFGVARCPANPKVFLVAGDWGFSLFADELRTPFLTSGASGAHITAGKWHPRRPSIVTTGGSNGVVGFWDLTQTHSRPSMSVKCGAAAIRCVAPHIAGEQLLASDAHGDVHLVRLPSVLVEPFPGEKPVLNSILEREYSRERTYQGRAKRGLSMFPDPEANAVSGPALVVNMPTLLRGDDDVQQQQLNALGSGYLKEVGFQPRGSIYRSATSPTASSTPARPASAISVREASPEVDIVDEIPQDGDMPPPLTVTQPTMMFGQMQNEEEAAPSAAPVEQSSPTSPTPDAVEQSQEVKRRSVTVIAPPAAGVEEETSRKEDSSGGPVPQPPTAKPPLPGAPKGFRRSSD